MWPVAAVQRGLSVCLSVCLLITRMCYAKMAELIEMQFGADCYRPKKPCIRWGSTSHMGMGNFGGCPAHWQILGVAAMVNAAKGLTRFSVPAWQQVCCSQVVDVMLRCFSSKICPHAMWPFVVKMFWPIVWSCCSLYKTISPNIA